MLQSAAGAVEAGGGEMRSGAMAIGVGSLVLASCASLPTQQEANDAVLMLQQWRQVWDRPPRTREPASSGTPHRGA